MADVKDILGLASRGDVAPKGTIVAPPKGLRSSKEKRSSMPRELQGLRDSSVWEDAETLAPTVRPMFKAKRTKAVSWKFLPIKSSARTIMAKGNRDSLIIKHWVKIHDAPDYRFARFNKQIKMACYTDEEYAKFLQDPTWSRKQTDRLFDLCKKFDLRFIAIYDHFVNPGLSDTIGREFLDDEEKELSVECGDVILSRDKSVEELKRRFYSIQKSLLTARNSSDPDLMRHPMFLQQYDKTYETERKAQLERVLSRSKGQVTKMAQLVLENRNLTHAIKALKRRDKQKGGHKSHKTGELAAVPTACLAKKQTADRPPGVTLRSTELANPLVMAGRHPSKQLESEVALLGIKKGRPFAVPTASVASAYAKLQLDVVTNLNLHKHILKLEAERDQQRSLARATAAKKNSRPTNKKRSFETKEKGVKRQKMR